MAQQVYKFRKLFFSRYNNKLQNFNFKYEH